MNPQLTSEQWAEVRSALLWTKIALEASESRAPQVERIQKILNEIYRSL